MAPCNLPTATSTADTDQSSAKCQFWQTDVGGDGVVHDSSCAERDVEDASCVLKADLFADDSATATVNSAAVIENDDQVDEKHSDSTGLQHSSASTESKM